MNRIAQKQERLGRRRDRVRFAIRSRKARPRLVFNRSNRFLAVQLIDDAKGVTLAHASTMEEAFKSGGKETGRAYGRPNFEAGNQADRTGPSRHFVSRQDC